MLDFGKLKIRDETDRLVKIELNEPRRESLMLHFISLRGISRKIKIESREIEFGKILKFPYFREIVPEFLSFFLFFNFFNAIENFSKPINFNFNFIFHTQMT